MIKKFYNFISENKKSDYLLYYAFDWDDNILIMPTLIYLEKKEDDKWVPIKISTSEFSKIKDDIENYKINKEKSFIEFTDYGPRGKNAFIEDIKKSINNKKFGPSWNDFIECITNGSLFAIITARGHESDTIRKGVEYIIDNYLTKEQQELMYNNLLKFASLFSSPNDNLKYDKFLKGKPSENELVKKYLDNCMFVGITSPSRGEISHNIEKAKAEALIEFKHKINKFSKNVGMKAKIGFSDDDLKNIKYIENLIDNIEKEKFPNIVSYVIKLTKYPNNIIKKVKNVKEKKDPSLESSIIPFSKVSNITNRLFPKGSYDRQDNFKNKLNIESDYILNLSKSIFKKKENKIKKVNKKSSK